MYSQGVAWYLSQFSEARPDQVAMEKTPKYLVTPGAPAALHAINPAAKIMLIVRDPVVRAISDFIHSFTKGVSRAFLILHFQKPGMIILPSKIILCAFQSASN